MAPITTTAPPTAIPAIAPVDNEEAGGVGENVSREVPVDFGVPEDRVFPEAEVVGRIEAVAPLTMYEVVGSIML